MTNNARLLMILGPTAVGKTAVACALQDMLGGKGAVRLISVDSALVYQGMDIGTAKPDATELADYPHDLIDIRDPADPYTAADFVEDADTAVGAALANGQVPVLVGGTMLYARCFLQGIADLPTASPEVRNALADELQAKGPKALYAELQNADPQAAQKIHPNNPQRLLRALEVLRTTGEPISRLWEQRAGLPATERLNVPVHAISLLPDDRAHLHARIKTRFAEMLRDGFVDEVRGLRDRGDLHLDLPSMRAVGYRQAWLYLAGEISEQSFIADALTATRRLAKRQLTWLRQWQDINQIRINDSSQVDQVAGQIIEDLRLRA